MTKDELATLNKGDKIVDAFGDGFFVGSNKAGDMVAYELPNGHLVAGTILDICLPKVKKYRWVMQVRNNFTISLKSVDAADAERQFDHIYKAIHRIDESESED